jgi:hypothetical protein
MDIVTSAVPAARFEHLVINEAGADLLAWDQSSGQFHHLNETSAAVWRLCDGHRSETEIAGSTGMAGEVVGVALAKLAGAGLLDGTFEPGLPGVTPSRRAFIKQGTIGWRFPTVVSVTTPMFADAASLTIHCGLVPSDCSNFPVCCASTCTQRGGSMVSAGLVSCTANPTPPGGFTAEVTCTCTV